MMIKLKPWISAWLGAAALLGLPGLLASSALAEDVILTARDGVKVFGTVSRASTQKPPIIICFHMAGSNRGEYTPISPKLVEAGFTVLAIDQRSGGQAFGGTNKTVAALGGSGSYAQALPDMEAALAWAKGEAHGEPVIVWGSSYSAALVFVLAANHPSDIAGVLSFSPGEYLGGSDTVHTAAGKVTAPVFITQSDSGGEISAARSILAAVAAKDKTQFIPKGSGVHGSSSLRADSNGSGSAQYWTAVLAFLNHLKS